MAWRLLQYNGAFDEFDAQCTPDMRDALRPKLANLALKGNQARYPLTEALGDGLFELRVKCKRVHMRLFFGFLPGQRIVFVWGGTKDQRRLPPDIIRQARMLLVEAIATQERINVAHLH
jgi:hypothetical protein